MRIQTYRSLSVSVLTLSDNEAASTSVQCCGCSFRSSLPRVEVSRAYFWKSNRLLNLTSQIESRGVSFAWGSQKVKGVSLGGWLVLEGQVVLPNETINC
jgi:hypothetical protein